MSRNFASLAGGSGEMPITVYPAVSSEPRALLKSQASVVQPGVIAAVSETLAEAGVSIESFLQKPVENTQGVPIVLTTHAAPEEVILEAVRRMADLAVMIERPRMIRIARI